MADRFALIRSVTHPDSTHTVAMHYMQTGMRHRRPNTNPTNLPDDFPCFGATMNLLNREPSVLPAGISLNAPGNEIPSGHIFPGFFAGFIGRHYDPMFVTDDPSQPGFNPFPIAGGLARARVDRRASRLGRLDRLRRRLDQVDDVRDAGDFQDKALSLINSPEAMRGCRHSRRHGPRRFRQNGGLSCARRRQPRRSGRHNLSRFGRPLGYRVDRSLGETLPLGNRQTPAGTLRVEELCACGAE